MIIMNANFPTSKTLQGQDSEIHTYNLLIQSW